MSIARKIASLVLRTKQDKRNALWLLVLMGVSAGLEVLGIGLVIPFVSVIDRPEIVDEHASLRWLRDVTGARTQFGIVLLFGLCLVAVFVLKNAYLYYVQYRQFRFTHQQQVSRSRELLESYLRRPYTFHLQNNSAELIHDINYEVASVYRNTVVLTFIILIEALSIFVIAFLIVFLEPIIIPGVVISLALVTMAFFRVLRKRSAALSERLREQQVQMVKATQQGLGGAKETRIIGCESFFVDAFDRSSREYGRSLVVYGLVSTVPRYVLETAGVAALVLITLAMFARGSDPHAVLPVLGGLAVAAIRLLPSMARILSSVATIRFHERGLDALCAAFAAAPAQEPAGLLRGRGVPRLDLKRELRLSDVEFTYPGAAEPSLRGISLTIRKGESVGLVGPSGGGKTTLADTLVGLLTPDKGTIELDGEELTGNRLVGWQRGIGYISQSIFLCDDTIRRNIAFGVEDADIDDERVQQALEAAQLDELVASLPEGLDTFVGERGVRISGGQRQRIGIARALYLSPGVLVLDEATSALDGATEREIVDAIERIRGDRTTIIVAHRLSTIRSCDRIVLISAGCVVETGNWDDLFARSEEFRQLVRVAQVERTKDAGGTPSDAAPAA